MTNKITLQVELPDNGYAELTGEDIVYYSGFGEPDFKGTIDAFQMEFPEVFAILLERSLIKEK